MKTIYWGILSFSLFVMTGCTNKETQARWEAEAAEEEIDERSLEEQAEDGDAEAQLMIGCEYDFGEYAGNYEEAVKWYRKSAEQGNSQAQNNLGFCYQKGNGVEQSYEEAMKWYLMAAGQNNGEAENSIGFFYNNGYGVEQDLTEAVKWYRKAAEHGSNAGMFNLGCRYLHGEGVAQDRNEAVKWIRKAADGGYQRAIDKLEELGE